MAKAKTAWMLHVEHTMKAHPEKAFKDVLKLAGKTYKKSKHTMRGGSDEPEDTHDAQKPMVSGGGDSSGVPAHSSEDVSSSPAQAGGRRRRHHRRHHKTAKHSRGRRHHRGSTRRRHRHSRKH